jgi:hypothetical protein
MRPAAGDEEVIDRCAQLGEEAGEPLDVTDVEGRDFRSELEPGSMEPLRVAGRQDYIRTVCSGAPST